MKKLAKLSIVASFYLVASLLGLGLFAVLALNQTVPKTDFIWQKPITGTIFSAICILGILAGLSPSRCSRTTHYKTTERSSSYAEKRSNEDETSMTFEGHHPTCSNFNSHVLSVGDRKFCAGCTGLVIGAIASLAGSFIYFFVGLQIGEFGAFAFWLGFMGVLFGLLQYKIPSSNSLVHFILNVTFVLGAFLLLVGANNFNESLPLDLYFIVLSVYWVLTRIELSRLEHRKKCLNCNRKSCSLSFNS